MTSGLFVLLLTSSLIIHFVCPNYPTLASTSMEGDMEGDMEDVLNENVDGPINKTIFAEADFFAVDDFEMINSTEQDMPINAKTSNKHGRPPKNGPPCRLYTTREKYDMLEVVGGRNQFYLAETPEEASKSFVSLSSSSPLHMKYADSVSEDEYCNEECETIRTTLENVIEQNRPRRKLWGPQTQLNDVGPLDIDEGFSSIESCVLETFIPIGNYSNPNDKITQTRNYLCPMRRGIYVLSRNCFPTFVNSILCDAHETGCIFDIYTRRVHGTCHLETLSLRVLRNRGSAKCEDWHAQHIEIPISCQCILNNNSWLQRTPKNL